MQKGAFDTLPASPFTRLRALLDDVTPPRAPVSLALGEPQHAPPSFALSAVSENIEQYRRYPPIAGTPDWQEAARGWLARRFGVSACVAQPQQVLPLNGTREGLFLAAQIAPQKPDGLMAMPDPFYQIYASAAVAAGATPHYLAATSETDHLPDLDAIDAAILARLRALYLCNPSNPQGAVADKAYLEKALALAVQHDFVLLVDECYAEIYDPQRTPPPSILQLMEAGWHDDAPVIAFHSLSKRSNLPGLRSGMAAGGATLMQAFHDLRQIAGPQCPMPAQAAAALAWGDDAHVEDNRARYGEKFDFAETVLAGSFDFYRPHAGFFLWLNVADGAAAALHLWQEEGLRVLPGGYLGGAHAAAYIRIALVADMAVTQDALPRLKTALDGFMRAPHHASDKTGGA
jgi:aspartate/methionine/tyrosine aminotransferase